MTSKATSSSHQFPDGSDAFPHRHLLGIAGLQPWEILFRFFTETLVNMVKAFIWPVYVVGINPPYGPIALGLAFWLFPKYLKKPIERWLFGAELARDEKAAE